MLPKPLKRANQELMDELRARIRSFLGLADAERGEIPIVHDEVRGDGFLQKAITYQSDGDTVPAFFFEPIAEQRRIAVVALHQHNSQWHLGKSEIAGLLGDPLQAFGPALARLGVAVLAPDAVGFESRRGASASEHAVPTLAPPLNPDRGSTADDWLQYYNHAMHRLVRGELLMRKVLTNAAQAVSVLAALAPRSSIGILGHSYGGNVALFAAALDTRLAFAVASGAACSYRYKLVHGVPLEMALIIPGFATRFDLDDLLRCVAPRRLFIVSSDADPYSADAADLVAKARPEFENQNCSEHLQHLHVAGAHALDPHRYQAILDWVSKG